MESPPDSRQQTANALWKRLEALERRVDALAAQPQSPSGLAERLADIIMMLDAPDAYNREYIAAVCRATMVSLTRPDRGGKA